MLPAGSARGKTSYRQWLELTAAEPPAFADAVASFHKLPRVSAGTIKAGKPLLDRFSARFLREYAVFPYETADGELHLAAADPSDPAIMRMMDLTLWQAGQARSRRLQRRRNAAARSRRRRAEASGANGEDAIAADMPRGGVTTTISTSCAIWHPARLWCARSTSCSSAPSSCGRPTFTSSRAAMPCRCGYASTACCETIPAPPPTCMRAIISRVKIMAGLNIAEKRLPQDGRIRRKSAGKDIDMRVATTPTAARRAHHDPPARPSEPCSLDLADIGFGDDHLRQVRRAISTGRTASCWSPGRPARGKTTRSTLPVARSTRPTSTSSPSRIRSSTSSTASTRSQVNPKIDLTFATGLRSFLRQDPDVIMVGEIRDRETARDRDPGLAHRPPGALDPPHQRRGRRDHAPARHGRRAVPGRLVAARAPRPAAGARLVPGLPPHGAAARKTTIVATPRYVALGLKPGDLVGEPVGCEPLQQRRLSRPARACSRSSRSPRRSAA